MKRIVVVLALVVMFALSGCDREVIPVSTQQALSESNYSLGRSYTKIDDQFFWDSAERAADLICGSIDEFSNYYVEFWLESSDGSSYVLSGAFYVSFYDDDWKRFWRNRLLNSLANVDFVAKNFEAGETVEVTGSTLEYREYDSLGLFKGVIILCDHNNDGLWDDIERGE